LDKTEDVAVFELIQSDILCFAFLEWSIECFVEEWGIVTSELFAGGVLFLLVALADGDDNRSESISTTELCQLVLQMNSQLKESVGK
jgi:hypothetical protein